MAYNMPSAPRSDCVVVDAAPYVAGDVLSYLYPAGKGAAQVESAPDGTALVRLTLDGMQFAILG